MPSPQPRSRLFPGARTRRTEGSADDIGPRSSGRGHPALRTSTYRVAGPLRFQHNPAVRSWPELHSNSVAPRKLQFSLCPPAVWRFRSTQASEALFFEGRMPSPRGTRPNVVGGTFSSSCPRPGEQPRTGLGRGHPALERAPTASQALCASSTIPRCGAGPSCTATRSRHESCNSHFARRRFGDSAALKHLKPCSSRAGCPRPSNPVRGCSPGRRHSCWSWHICRRVNPPPL